MEFLHWNDKKMSVGIKLIDDQHKELLKITNQLATSIHECSQKEEILLIVEELIDYAKYHFKSEEELFDKFCFEETVSHKEEHTRFLNKFISMKNEITHTELYLTKNALETAEDVFKYIINWLLKHIVGSDRKYIDLLQLNNVR